MQLLFSPNRKKHNSLTKTTQNDINGWGKKKPTQFCVLVYFLLNVLEKSGDLESICMGRKCHYVPDFGKIECSLNSLWN